MNAKARASLLVAAALPLFCASAFSWGPEGHETISDIAQARLDPRTQAGIAAVLGSQSIRLADISNYPDALRYGDTDGGGLFNPPLSKDPASAPWHFINIPIEASVSRTPTTDDLGQYHDCDEKATGATAQLMGDTAQDCIQAQIKFAISQLNAPAPAVDPLASAAESAQAAALLQRKRRVALMYLVHLVGDAHQPMHTSIDHNDAGGNAEHVEFENRLERLHELWDDLIDKTAWQNQAPGAANALAQQLIAQLDALPQDEVAGWISADVDTAINNAIGESFNISKNTIYPDYYKLRKDQPGAKPVVLPPGYQAQMQPIAYKRLQQAGVRLAYILNQINWDGVAAPVAPAAKSNRP
ncbi:MAG: S1/P1 nuclease [Elusimicrobiota bacterium]